MRLGQGAHPHVQRCSLLTHWYDTYYRAHEKVQADENSPELDWTQAGM